MPGSRMMNVSPHYMNGRRHARTKFFLLLLYMRNMTRFVRSNGRQMSEPAAFPPLITVTASGRYFMIPNRGQRTAPAAVQQPRPSTTGTLYTARSRSRSTNTTNSENTRNTATSRHVTNILHGAIDQYQARRATPRETLLKFMHTMQRQPQMQMVYRGLRRVYRSLPRTLTRLMRSRLLVLLVLAASLPLARTPSNNRNNWALFNAYVHQW